MKFNSDNIAIILGFIIVIFIVLTISGHTSYVRVPGRSNAYEAFKNLASPYSTYQTNSNIDNPVDKYSIVEKSCSRKIRGFDGLFPSPNFDDSKIDPFLQLQGSLDSKVGTLSNSKGYLQLGPNEVRLLSTRGGNATGNNFEQSAK
jgi:hypothetical protein